MGAVVKTFTIDFFPRPSFLRHYYIISECMYLLNNILRIVLIHSKCKINAEFDIHFYRKLTAVHASRTLSSQSSGTDIKKASTDVS